MPLASKTFEDNLIKTIVGVIVLVVGAALVGTAGNLMFRASLNAYYIVPGVLVFVVGVVLLYFGLRILFSILKKLGVDL